MTPEQREFWATPGIMVEALFLQMLSYTLRVGKRITADENLNTAMLLDEISDMMFLAEQIRFRVITDEKRAAQ